VSGRPETHYATGPGGHIAYQVLGDGPRDVVFLSEWYHQVEAQWDSPLVAHGLERLASFSRMLSFDPRGVGLSDPVPIASIPTLEEWVDDIRCVMDAVGSQHASLVACSGSGPLAILFAATFPGRTSALVLFNSYARFRRAPDFPIGATDEAVEAGIATTHDEWGTGGVVPVVAPSKADDDRFRQWFGAYQRVAMSPGAGVAIQRMLFDIDVRDVLSAVQAPTLVVHRAGDRFVRSDHGRYLAEHIPGARLVELEGGDHVFYAGDSDAVIDEIESFLTGARRGPEPDRVLATLLFTDIVGSTARAAAMGDRAWRSLLDQHHAAVRHMLERFRGREVNTAGDGFFAAFEGPARGIRCAFAIRESVGKLGLDVRIGLHTGEVEMRADELAGIAVHVGARVGALAGTGEVLVTRTVKDLVAGSGILFADRGTHALKGVPDDWQLYAAAE